MAGQTQEQNDPKQAHVREMYEWYADDDNSVCKKEHIANLLRVIGFNPTEEDVTAWEVKLGCEENEDFTWEILWENVQSELPQVEDEQSKLKAAFAMFDKDESRYLDVQELKDGLKKYLPGMNDEELEDFFKVIDVNEDGKVDYEEFSKTLTDFRVNLDN